MDKIVGAFGETTNRSKHAGAYTRVTQRMQNKMSGFVEYQCSVGQGVQGYVGKFCVTLAVVVCQQEK